MAAFLVFVHHYNPVQVAKWPWLHHLLNEMHVGVSLFFVLSGFLIASLYKNSVFDREGITLYLKKRFARIFPLWFLLTSLTFGYWFLTKSNHDYSLNTFLMNLTLLKGFSNELKFTGIGPGWSLTVEETFYLAAPVIFLLGRKWGWWWQPMVIYGLVLLAFASSPGVLSFQQTSFVLIYTFAGRCFEFYCGIQLSIWVTRSPTRFSTNPYPWHTWGGFSCMIVCILLMTGLSLSNRISLDRPAGVLLNNIMLPGAVAWLYFGLMKETSWLSKLLSSALMQQLGKSSYAFYLLHAGIIAGLFIEYVSRQPVMVFLFLVFFSWVLYRLVEEPCRKWLCGKS